MIVACCTNCGTLISGHSAKEHEGFDVFCSLECSDNYYGDDHFDDVDDMEDLDGFI